MIVQQMYKSKVMQYIFGPSHENFVLIAKATSKAQTSLHSLISCFSNFVCFVGLRPKSTAMVMAGLSVHLTKLEQAVNQYFMHILLLVTDNNPS